MAAKPSAFKAYIEVNGDAQAADMIRGVGARARDTLPLMVELVDVLQMQQARRVAANPYLPLSEETVARKTRENENPETFRDESRYIHHRPTRTPDAMYRALTETTYPGQLKHATRTTATFGLQSAGQGPFFYARFVQNVKGTKRRILAISSDDAMILLGWVEQYIMGPVWGERLGNAGAGKPTGAAFREAFGVSPKL